MIPPDDSLAARDLRHVWHPCSQMTDYQIYPPLEVAAARGSRITLADGSTLLDGISSWWCKSLGHGHPAILAAVRAQMERFEHVILANTTNAVIVGLAERLSALCPGLSRSFFVDSGSDAIEVAVKMSVQHHQLCGQPRRHIPAALGNGYHGETILNLALSASPLYGSPFADLFPPAIQLPAPFYIYGEAPADGGPAVEARYDAALEEAAGAHADTIACVVAEPLVQGAGGMLVYDAACLRALRRWCSRHGIHLIHDEIMSGCGRTGTILAAEQAGVIPDILCLSKGLSSGFGPFSAVLTRQDFYEAFLGEFHSGRAFMHSNTFCGHALGAAAACATLDLITAPSFCPSVRAKGEVLRRLFAALAAEFAASGLGLLLQQRGRGLICAADLRQPDGAAFPREERIAWRAAREAARFGLLLRPLGDTIYLLPPLTTSEEELAAMVQALRQALHAAITSFHQP